jgi:hypothetical protein
VRFDGRWVSVEGDTVVFALPNEPHRQRCEEIKGDVEAGLSSFYARPLTLRLVVETELGGAAGGRPSAAPPDDVVLEHDLAPVEATGPTPEPPVDAVTRLTQEFPGSVVVGEEVRDVR